jgi:purine-binding chemotaxis protein CheW
MDAKKENVNNSIMACDFMPKDESIQKELMKRAKILAVKHETNEDQTKLVKYIKFKLGKKELYGIPYKNIKEVVGNFMLTPIPNLPTYIAGIINLRGSLIAVINLKIFFSITDVEESNNLQIIIVNKGDMIVGILVDYLVGSEVYDPSSLDLPMLSKSIAPEFIVGINQGNTAIINVEMILSDSNLHIETKSKAIQ